MSKKLYVGNLNYSTTEDTLKAQFSNYGELLSVSVIKDRYTQQSKGFGFVEMADDSAAEKAIAELNGREIDGRKVRVNVAEDRQRPPRGPREDGGGRQRPGFGRDRGFSHRNSRQEESNG
ncbi:MAG: RNA-binding protein [Treponema sp.]|nr:RNA-binding protein [Treponema sp.]